MEIIHPTNEDIAEVLKRIADLLEAQDANRYRVKAYRRGAQVIADPEGKSWMPIMHTEKEGWHFTALYSNTARAHELNKTRDWVVIYFERDGEEEQYTVVTEPDGPLRGRRVVRGREKECRTYYSNRH